MNSLPASTAISRLVLLAWCAMGVASTANAQAGWTGTVATISLPSPSGLFQSPPPPAVAVDGKGNVTALWWRGGALVSRYCRGRKPRGIGAGLQRKQVGQG